MKSHLLIALLLASMLADAEVLPKTRKMSKTGIACQTAEYSAQARDAIRDKDEDALLWLMNNVCIQLKPGMTFTLLSSTFDGTVKIRLYLPKGKAAELFAAGYFLE